MLLCRPIVKKPTIRGEMKPVRMENDELMPNETPAKLGLMSTIDANGPLETAPCSISETVKKMTANTTWQPENAKAMTASPFKIKPANLNKIETSNKKKKSHRKC